MSDYARYLETTKDIIAMIHIPALPGSPDHTLPVRSIIDKSISEARLYKRIGYKTVMIENMHDIPYVKQIGPEITSVMSIVGYEIKRLGLFCGIQVLAGGNREALAVALAADLDFIRVEGFVFAHVGDEGIYESCAGDIFRYRRRIGADKVLVFTDIKKKHAAHAITADVTLKDTAKSAVFFKSDGIVITGDTTGCPPDIQQLRDIQDVPVRKIIGSGLTSDNIKDFYPLAQIFIVGSTLKKRGYWANDPDPDRAAEMRQTFVSING